MSKNVAVFVDVANIFYAAKAAGIDIDYVTLLKSATAGRDFVRAYAYTGLDPENENQRQFHNFLARNGYKVISKDIRKYGDGRIKANLDIELVVDMMKTARNLDIAVVVSGDGDFAPAIRAVQEQGVRVEVISFRGNTSSDLIEVADLFTDIAQIARVEKSSARSGRRVAAEGDLSMTEVPEKETEGAPRRRRGRGRDEDRRGEVAAAATPVALPAAGRGQGNLIALPGERLSRGAMEGEAMDVGETAELTGDEGAEFAAQSENGSAADLGDERRRRRRRGGRGRGRGRRVDGEAYAPGEAPEGGAEVAGSDEEDDFEDAQPAQPAHQSFGSVWDSQIGVPSSMTGTSGAGASATPSMGGDVDENGEDLDEPEIPEYLLAERRQRGQRPGTANRGGGGRMVRGNRSAYQAALDRERFGSGTRQPSGFGANSGGGSSGFGANSGSSNLGVNSGSSRPDRSQGGRDRGRGGRPQQGRPMERQPRFDARPMSSEPRSSEPWSEVPPDIEEMLRAEIARKSGPSEPRSTAQTTSSPEQSADQPLFTATPVDEPVAEAPAKPVRRTRSTKSTTTAPAAAETVTAEAAPSEAAPAAQAAAPKRRASTRSTTSTTSTTSTRARTTKATASAAPADSEATPDAAPEAAPAAKPAKPATRRRKTATPAAEEG
ncbi:MAG: NYN domain-containing protein [Candidatus Limnocylindrales bacterium]